MKTIIGRVLVWLGLTLTPLGAYLIWHMLYYQSWPTYFGPIFLIIGLLALPLGLRLRKAKKIPKSS